MSNSTEICWFCKTEAASAKNSVTVKLYKELNAKVETKEIIIPRCDNCERTLSESPEKSFPEWGVWLAFIISIIFTIVYGYSEEAKIGWAALICVSSFIGLLIPMAIVTFIVGFKRFHVEQAKEYPAVMELLNEGWIYKLPKDKRQRVPKVNVRVMENRKDIDGLLAALKTRDANIRRKAINALGRIGDERAIMPLINALNTEVAFAVKIDAVKALGNLGDERAIQPLTRALESEYTTAGGFSDMADLARQAVKARQNIDVYKQAIKDALEKIRVRIAKE